MNFKDKTEDAKETFLLSTCSAKFKTHSFARAIMVSSMAIEKAVMLWPSLSFSTTEIFNILANIQHSVPSFKKEGHG